mgnify:CR=1 FL=1
MKTMLFVGILAVLGYVQQTASWRDPARHDVQFVTVGDGVRLEVLDWGGSGRSIVLLAGSGNTAHVFDDFAPKLTDCCHVYGITRRGFGASDRPESGYDDQRLADDVLQVLDSLGMEAPVLVGHSMAGGELTTLGNQHSDRLAGLVYLDALGDPRDWPGTDISSCSRSCPPRCGLLPRRRPRSPGRSAHIGPGRCRTRDSRFPRRSCATSMKQIPTEQEASPRRLRGSFGKLGTDRRSEITPGSVCLCWHF